MATIFNRQKYGVRSAGVNFVLISFGILIFPAVMVCVFLFEIQSRIKDTILGLNSNDKQPTTRGDVLLPWVGETFSFLADR